MGFTTEIHHRGRSESDTKDVGVFLTVNDQYNLVWTDFEVTARAALEYNLPKMITILSSSAKFECRTLCSHYERKGTLSKR